MKRLTFMVLNLDVKVLVAICYIVEIYPCFSLTPQMRCKSLPSILRIVGTTLFGLALLVGIAAAYIVGYQFIATDNYYFSFGLYGAILSLHLLIQSLFAFLEHRKMKRSLETPIKLNKTVALCIAAYQEDPDYLRKCLLSVKRLSYPGMIVIMVIDGNNDDDRYMMEIFGEVMGRDRSASYLWKSNFHERGPGESEESHRESMQYLTGLIRSNKSVCVMQKWGGKREVMYTAFKALGRTVDYVQVRLLTLEMVPINTRVTMKELYMKCSRCTCILLQ